MVKMLVNSGRSAGTGHNNSMEKLAHKAQVAALPVKGKPGSYQVLLVTSRETQRWIIPKGWPMKGRKDHEAAAQEAIEEAGVTGPCAQAPMGSYTYQKRLGDVAENVSVMVYLLEVDTETGKWPEKDQRQRKWLAAREAAKRVDESGLSAIIKQLEISAMNTRNEEQIPSLEAGGA